LNARKRIASALLAAVLLLPAPPAAAEEVPSVSARTAILMDADTGESLYEKDANTPGLIASCTKIMTALLTLESCDLDEEVEVPAACAGVEGSSIYLRAGEVLTVEDLLYGLLLESGNDAAAALAWHVSGGIEAFADRMNARAAELGLANTAFENPHGLDGEHQYSSARDLAVLTAAALENETFRQIVSTRQITAAGRTMTNHNRLLDLYDGAIGVKTGYTQAAGRILVSAAERDGRTLVCVTLGDPDDWNDHMALLDYGFARCGARTLAAAGQVVCRLPVIGGRRETVAVRAAETVTRVLLDTEEVLRQVYLPRFVYAGIRAGDEAGYLLFTLPTGEQARVPLTYVSTVEQADIAAGDFWTLVDRMT